MAPADPPPGGGDNKKWIERALWIVGIAILAVVWILMAGSRPVADQLADPEYARGVITLVFVLFTIGFAAIVMLHGLFESSASQDDRRFTRGREVLGVFVGIVGTIVGFYFGSTEKTARPFDVAVQAVREDEARVRVDAHAVGGTAPYRFSIHADDDDLTKQAITSDAGWLTHTVAVEASSDITELTVTVLDAKDQTAKQTATIGAPKTEQEQGEAQAPGASPPAKQD